MPTASYEVVTKSIAENLLERNRANRPLRPSWARTISLLMDSGQWMPNSSGIGIDTDGYITNGQHRLTGVTMMTTDNWPMILVCRGLGERSYLTEDDGKKRQARDILVRNPDEAVRIRSVSSTLRAMLAYSRPTQLNGAWTNLLAMKHFEQFMDSVLFAAAMSPSARAPLTSPVLGVIARASHDGADKEMLDNFATVMRENRPIIGDPIEDNALLLARVVVTTGRVGGPGAKDLTLRTERALSAYLNGERLQKLHPSRTNPWPVFAK